MESLSAEKSVEHASDLPAGETASQISNDGNPDQDARLVFKIDLCLLPILCLLYISAFIDRINIGNARLNGLEKDLKLKGYDYNVALTAFFISYIVFEVPMLLLCKKFGPGRLLPLCTFAFGLFSMCTAFATNHAQLAGLRFLLGIAEAPMLPGIAYYLSRWYKKDELVFRLGVYVVCSPLGGAFGGLLATVLGNLDGIGKLHTWQQIFFVEGLITMGIGAIGLLLLSDNPGVARWLTPSQRSRAVHRIMEERKVEDVFLDDIQRHRVFSNIFETQTLVLGLLFLLNNITVQGASVFTPTIVATLFPNSSTVNKQLHTVSPYAVGGFTTAAVPYLSWKFKQRGVFVAGCAVLTIIGYALFVGSHDKHTRFGGSHLVMAGAFPIASLLNGWISANAVNDSGRATSIACVAMFGNIGGLISTWSYLPKDAPNYLIGNGLNLGTSSAWLLLTLGLLAWMKWKNSRKDKDTSIEAVEKSQLGRQHPAYRYTY